MKTHKLIMGLFAIIVTIMVAGEASIYLADPYEYSSEMNSEEYRVSSSVAADFTILQYTNKVDFEKIYLYYDGDYSSPLGISKRDVEEFATDLKIRHISASIVNATDIKTIISTVDPNKNVLAFIDGGLPETIYSGQATDDIFTWFDNGGHVFWSGPAIGKYVCTTEEMVEIDSVRYSLFFSEGTINESKTNLTATIPDTGIGKSLCIRSSRCEYGLSASTPNTLSLGYVSEDGYCAMAMTKFHNGFLLIEGSTFGDTERSDASQVLAAGVSIESHVVNKWEEHCHGNSKKGTVDDLPGTGVYIFCGGDYTCYGKAFRI